MTRIYNFARSRLNSGAWALVVLAIIEVLSNLLSDGLTAGRLTPNEIILPRSMLYFYWVAFIVLLLAAVTVLWLRDDRRRLRWAAIAINSLFTAQLFIASLLLVRRLVQSIKITVVSLIGDALIIILAHDYKIEQGGPEIAEAANKRFCIRDSYRVDIQPGQADAMILAITAVIDQMTSDSENQEVNSWQTLHRILNSASFARPP